MLYNKNIILEIIRTHFGDEIELEVFQSVMDLDGFVLVEVFEDLVDYADLGSIEEIAVHEYDITENDGMSTIEGILKVQAILEGYVHWDGEDVFVDSCSSILNYAFKFNAENESYVDFEIEYISAI